MLRTSRDAIVIAGSIARKPGFGGHTWALLQYALGFRELGWNVLVLDQMSASQFTDGSGAACSPAKSVQLEYLRDVMKWFNLEDNFALDVVDSAEWIGVPRPRALETTRGSAFLLNIMGFLRDDEILAAAPKRVFLDIDPGFGQMWKALGLHDAFDGYDAHVTIGERIGAPDCEVPPVGIQWITTAQPVALSWWPPAPTASRAFTTIASWRGAYGPVDYGGKRYGLRVHEFRKFVDLPRRAGLPFEIALDIHPADAGDLAALVDGGWSIVEPRDVAGTPRAYREYIQRSAAEIMIAKNMYVETRSGWVSDRSLCYLASGKPVLAQDTGWPRLYPAGRGLVSFRTLEDAQAGAAEISANYDAHSRSARNLAEQYFDARVILGRLLQKLGVE